MSSSMAPSYPDGRGRALFGCGEALVVGRDDTGARNVLVALLVHRCTPARRLGKQRQLVELVLDHRFQREIGVVVAPGIVLDLPPDAVALPGELSVDLQLL